MRSDVALVEVLETPSFVAQPRDLIAIKAKASLERGLRRKGFDVFAEPGDPQRFVLYEIYEDQGALDDRLASSFSPSVANAIENQIEARPSRRRAFFTAMVTNDEIST